MIDCHELSKRIVSDFVKITVPSNEGTLNAGNAATTENTIINDSVYLYAVDLLTMGLFWYAYRDAIKEGDGERIMRHWKFLAAIFRQERHYNYANEGFNLLAQITLLSPRQASGTVLLTPVAVKVKTFHIEHLTE